jgi:hypothetical protein
LKLKGQISSKLPIRKWNIFLYMHLWKCSSVIMASCSRPVTRFAAARPVVGWAIFSSEVICVLA